MKPWSVEPRGRFEQQTVTSRALEGNPLGDPVERPLWVYLPPGVGDDPGRRYPCIYVIQGHTGQVDMWWNRSALRPTVPELVEELFAGPGPEGSRSAPPPAIVAFVDCWTFVDARYPTMAAREHRGIAGKSSGGYGAMVAPMLRDDMFGALASHTGDALFEYCYLFWLDLGAAAVSAELDALGIEHTFELFDATHSGIEYRYPRGLAFLAERLGS